MLNMHGVSSMEILTTKSLLYSRLNLQLGSIEGVAQVNGVQSLAIGTSSANLLVDNIKLRRVCGQRVNDVSKGRFMTHHKK
jgi:hypothetical protein